MTNDRYDLEREPLVPEELIRRVYAFTLLRHKTEEARDNAFGRPDSYVRETSSEPTADQSATMYPLQGSAEYVMAAQAIAEQSAQLPVETTSEVASVAPAVSETAPIAPTPAADDDQAARIKEIQNQVAASFELQA